MYTFIHLLVVLLYWKDTFLFTIVVDDDVLLRVRLMFTSNKTMNKLIVYLFEFFPVIIQFFLSWLIDLDGFLLLIFSNDIVQLIYIEPSHYSLLVDVLLLPLKKIKIISSQSKSITCFVVSFSFLRKTCASGIFWLCDFFKNDFKLFFFFVSRKRQNKTKVNDSNYIASSNAFLINPNGYKSSIDWAI